MAQHSLTFNDILAKNVRHVYSGLPTEIRFRRPKHQHALELHQRIYEEQTRPPDRFQLRVQEYLPRFNISLPRAPAFRQVSQSEMKDIVFRVSKPTNSSRKPCHTCHREIARQYEDNCILCEMNTFKHSASRAEIRGIVSRLSRQTQSSIRRSILRTMNPDPMTSVRPCTAQERLVRPTGTIDCCIPCQILHDTHWRKRPRSSLR
ncbi:uncharacterized protein LOC121384733 [Gigantopelta aegis]|uniref:uncharacterized protein LOC121384733 n=1 Tax=Gigantopelta aegis TaxID=1735272 RepID=UPI001B88A732|nr:uncharacterized protein LOC121384733 [Gigantopelta aegis]XP_041371194.1 uncharacterized protein LOC121384733 [Gigantopelta aegis]